MKWNDTISSKCRYGSIAERIFANLDIIWEDSEDDYQGTVKLIALMENSDIVTFTYNYGSCSGCDDWEAVGYNDDQIEQAMRKECMEVFTDYKEFLKYVQKVNLYKEISNENLLRFLVMLGEKGVFLKQ